MQTMITSLRAWLLILSVLALVGCDEPARPEPAAVGPVSTAMSEPPPPPKHVGNGAAGKKTAEKCAKCHGMDGVRGVAGAPFIAGLEQDYLIRSMLAYSNGARKHADMKHAVEALPPEELANVSAYYAELKSAWKGTAFGHGEGGPSISPKAVAAGEVIAARCNSCHGPSGNAQKDEVVPSLAGMPVDYFLNSLKSYFKGGREHSIMRLFSYSLDQNEIKNLAAYYAVQKPALPPAPSNGDANAGRARAGACAGCHGGDGNSMNPHMPSLAGQPAEYLVKAIKDYRENRRHDPLMRDAVQGLGDKAITDLAAFYATRRPESPLKSGSDSKRFDPIADGKKIAASCNGCHGEGGRSTIRGTPSLAGLHPQYLLMATQRYQDGTRRHKVMQTMVSYLSEADIEKAAFYYATQAPAAAEKPSKGNAATGAKVANLCASCHGEGGISHDPVIPSLAGQDASYLVAATRAYGSGGRKHDLMKDAVAALTDQQILDMAAYYALQTPQKPDVRLPEEPQYIVEKKCSRCHGERGHSTQPGIPRLAGQVEPYLVVAMREYQDETRKSTTMHAMSDILSLAEIKAVAAYYAKQ